MDSARYTQCQGDIDCTFRETCCLHNRTALSYYCCPTVSASDSILWIVSIFFGISVFACVLGVLKQKLNIRFGRSATGSSLCCCHRSRTGHRGGGSPVSRRRHVSVRVRTAASASHPSLTATWSSTSSVDCSVLVLTAGSRPPPYSVVSGNAALARSSHPCSSSSVVHSPAMPEEPPNYSDHMLTEELPPAYYGVDVPLYGRSVALGGGEVVPASSEPASLPCQPAAGRPAAAVL